jgi:hypothetical protein
MTEQEQWQRQGEAPNMVSDEFPVPTVSDEAPASTASGEVPSGEVPAPAASGEVPAPAARDEVPAPAASVKVPASMDVTPLCDYEPKASTFAALRWPSDLTREIRS